MNKNYIALILAGLVLFAFYFLSNFNSQYKTKRNLKKSNIEIIELALGNENSEGTASDNVIFDGERVVEIFVTNPEKFNFNLFEEKIRNEIYGDSNVIRILYVTDQTLVDGKWIKRKESLEILGKKLLQK